MKNFFFTINSESKRAQIEVSFNWIFVLIAGAAILIFFVFVITKETSSAEEKAGFQVSKRMEALLSAVEQNPSAVKDLGYFVTEISFDCVDNSLHQYYIKDSVSRQDLDTQILFSPKEVGAAKIIAWTLDFKSPYPASSMLLISDEKTLYVFDDSISSSFISEFPKQFNKQTVPFSSINSFDDTGFRRYIFVVSSTNLNSIQLSQAIKLKSSVVSLPDNLELFSGNINFYEYEHQVSTNLKNKGSASFVTREMLYGAVISGNAGLYNCSLSKLLDRTRFVDDINSERLNKIKSQIPSQSICRTIYNQLIGPSGVIEKKRQASANFHSQNERENFVSAYREIENANGHLQSNTCTMIY